MAGLQRSPFSGSYGPVDAVAVALARLDRRQVAVPDERVDLGHRDPGLDAVVVEQAQLDLLGHLAEDREVGAAAVERRAQRVRRTRPDLHGPSWSFLVLGVVRGRAPRSHHTPRVHPRGGRPLGGAVADRGAQKSCGWVKKPWGSYAARTCASREALLAK